MSDITTVEKPHGRLSASKAPQYINCPAAPALSDRVPASHNDEDDYNVLGTAAHALAEHCFRACREPKEFLGKTVFYDDATDTTIVADEEMISAIEHYVGYVTRLAASPFTLSTFIEECLTSTIDPNVTGIVDAGILLEKRLLVIDYKHGVGVAVDPTGSEQLLTYAVLMFERLDEAEIDRLEEVVLVIIQPRHFNADDDGVVKTWTTTPEVVKRHRQTLIDAVRRVEKSDMKELTEGLGAQDTNPGDHCRWCRAKALCPGIYTENVVAMFGESMPAIDFAAPEEITPQHMAYILELEDRAKAFFKAVRSFVFKELQRGSADYPDFKLVEKQGNRKYSSDEEALKKLSRKYKKSEVTTAKLLSPAQIEKKFPGKEAKEFVAQLTFRPITGSTLTRVTNARPEIETTTAAEDFGPVVDGKVIESTTTESLF